MCTTANAVSFSENRHFHSHRPHSKIVSAFVWLSGLMDTAADYRGDGRGFESPRGLVAGFSW